MVVILSKFKRTRLWSRTCKVFSNHNQNLLRSQFFSFLSKSSFESSLRRDRARLCSHFSLYISSFQIRWNSNHTTILDKSTNNSSKESIHSSTNNLKNRLKYSERNQLNSTTNNDNNNNNQTGNSSGPNVELLYYLNRLQSLNGLDIKQANHLDSHIRFLKYILSSELVRGHYRTKDYIMDLLIKFDGLSTPYSNLQAELIDLVSNILYRQKSITYGEDDVNKLCQVYSSLYRASKSVEIKEILTMLHERTFSWKKILFMYFDFTKKKLNKPIDLESKLKLLIGTKINIYSNYSIKIPIDVIIDLCSIITDWDMTIDLGKQPELVILIESYTKLLNELATSSVFLKFHELSSLLISSRTIKGGMNDCTDNYLKALMEIMKLAKQYLLYIDNQVTSSAIFGLSSFSGLHDLEKEYMNTVYEFCQLSIEQNVQTSNTNDIVPMKDAKKIIGDGEYTNDDRNTMNSSIVAKKLEPLPWTRNDVRRIVAGISQLKFESDDQQNIFKFVANKLECYHYRKESPIHKELDGPLISRMCQAITPLKISTPVECRLLYFITESIRWNRIYKSNGIDTNKSYVKLKPADLSFKIASLRDIHYTNELNALYYYAKVSVESNETSPPSSSSSSSSSSIYSRQESYIYQKLSRNDTVRKYILEILYILEANSDITFNSMDIIIICHGIKHLTGTYVEERLLLEAITKHIRKFMLSIYPGLNSNILMYNMELDDNKNDSKIMKKTERELSSTYFPPNTISLIQSGYTALIYKINRSRETLNFFQSIFDMFKYLTYDRVIDRPFICFPSLPNHILKYISYGLQNLTGTYNEERQFIAFYAYLLRCRLTLVDDDGTLISLICRHIENFSGESISEQVFYSEFGALCEASLHHGEFHSWGISQIFKCFRKLTCLSSSYLRLLSALIDIIKTAKMEDGFTSNDLVDACKGMIFRNTNNTTEEEIIFLELLLERIELGRYQYDKSYVETTRGKYVKMGLPNSPYAYNITSDHVAGLLQTMKQLPGQGKIREKQVIQTILNLISPFIDEITFEPIHIGKAIDGLQNITCINSEEDELISFIHRIVKKSPMKPFETSNQIVNACFGLRHMNADSQIMSELIDNVAERIAMRSKNMPIIDWSTRKYHFIALGCMSMQSLSCDDNDISSYKVGESSIHVERKLLNALTESISSYLDYIHPNIEICSGLELSFCCRGLRSLNGYHIEEKNFIKLVNRLIRMNNTAVFNDQASIDNAINSIQNLKELQDKDIIDLISLLGDMLQRTINKPYNNFPISPVIIRNICYALHKFSGKTPEQKLLLRGVTGLIISQGETYFESEHVARACYGMFSMTGDYVEERQFIEAFVKHTKFSNLSSLSSDYVLMITDGLSNLKDDYLEVQALKQSLILSLHGNDSS